MQKLPFSLYPQKMERISSSEVKASNFSIAKEFGRFMASTLGPQSAQKVIIGSDFQHYTLSSDGKTILQRFDLAEFKAIHPVAQLMVELAKTTDDEVGDGTTSSVVIAGELLRRAEKLIDEGLHPAIVAEGYKKATKKAIELMEDLAVSVNNDEMLEKVAKTAIDTKYMSSHLKRNKETESLANVVVSAIHMVADEDGRADPDYIHVVKKSGGDIYDTMVFPGFIVEKEMVHPSMPKYLEDAKIALLDAPLTVKRYDGLFGDISNCNLKMEGLDQYKSQKNQEREVLDKMIEKITATGANVIISRKIIDERLGSSLADKGIIAIPAIPTKEDLNRLSKTCGANIISDIGAISSEDLGFADSIREERHADRSIFILISIKDANSATVILRGGIAHARSDISRAIHDALHTTANAYNNKILPGGGATEMYIAEKLRRYALTIKTKQQLSINAFAEALEIIPKTLAKNSGQDPISVNIDLRKEHADGNNFIGLDTIKRSVIDTVKEGIIEPLITKKQVYKGASETAQLILLSDDIIYGNVIEERIEEKVHGG
ncbi:MAG: thermosome subunit alpha [Halobacteriota archaeon]|nr:thermosome subunit alpha [Halobacteriota archaeon]